MSFVDSHLLDNTWVSGVAQVELLLPGVGAIGFGFDVPLPISRAVLVMNLNEDHSEATGGILAGVIPTEALIATLQQAAGYFDPGLCTGSTFDSLANQLRQASDIMADGTQDPAKTCDAISIGIGFEAAAAQLGPIGQANPLPPNPCE